MTVLAVLPGKAPEQMDLDGSLESMQKFVGGTIQAVYPFSDPVAIVCHDEGKLIGLEHNRALRDSDGNVFDILCGPFFVCGLAEENFASLSEKLVEKYARLFQHPELFLRVGNQLIVVPF
ncbi:MAG: DUF3846 domain-containing protein [Faecousia sp.]